MTSMTGLTADIAPAPSPAPPLALPAASTLSDMLAHFALLAPVFDAMPDIVFFVKDREARYAMVNRTLARRCGHKDNKSALLGKTAEDVFPRRFGRMHLHRAESGDHRAGTSADRPTRAASLSGARTRLVHDVQAAVARQSGPHRRARWHLAGPAAAEGTHPAYSRLAAVVQHIQENYVQPLNMRQLAQMANMSITQLERYFQQGVSSDTAPGAPEDAARRRHGAARDQRQGDRCRGIMRLYGPKRVHATVQGDRRNHAVRIPRLVTVGGNAPRFRARGKRLTGNRGTAGPGNYTSRQRRFGRARCALAEKTVRCDAGCTYSRSGFCSTSDAGAGRNFCLGPPNRDAFRTGAHAASHTRHK